MDRKGGAGLKSLGFLMRSRTQRQAHGQRWELPWARLLSTDSDLSLVDHKLCRCRGDPWEARLKKKPPPNNPEQDKQDVIGCSSGGNRCHSHPGKTLNKQPNQQPSGGGKSRTWIPYNLLPNGSRIALIPKPDKDIATKKTANQQP